jgi:predicted helicase
VSQLLIQRYLNELQTLRRVSGTTRESVVSEAFKTLLKDWGKSQNLIFIPQYEYQTLQRTRVYPDGALAYELRVPLGYWEAKDSEDDLGKEIEKKFRKGYPQDNIIFEDSREAILIQNKQEVMRCGVHEPAKLQALLEVFFCYERAEIVDFRKAVEQFKIDLPEVLKALRTMIEAAERGNESFRTDALRFLKHAQDTINPNVTAADVREMLIQHILTEEIFSQVYDNAEFHRQNNVAKELYALERTFFTGKVKHDTLIALKPYYAAIKSAAALVTSHHEKQKFLKVIYETFYKVYDKKKADRLGVIYTPNEIVRFMIESADWLCQKYFDKALIDKNVEILDPATGTGTFITELIEHFRGQPGKLRYKYLEELHANEVAILPYYVANLNIEATYGAINGYEEYPNLCFVDTLDNTAALRADRGRQGDLFGAVSDVNVARIRRQNERTISVIIGNPPYNANQLNENENNKNREYPEIDRRIKDTYIAASQAQKTKQYDMFVRFFRWASDRIGTNGILAFITNRSFIDKFNFDGFRRTVAVDFNYLSIVDLGGDWRVKGSGGGGNVFGIGTGVAISFFVRKKVTKKTSGQITLFYPSASDVDGKLSWLASTRLGDIKGQIIKPDALGYWTNQVESSQIRTVPIVSKAVKATKIVSQAQCIFKSFSLGISTNRDEWLYDFERKILAKKANLLVERYNSFSFETEEYTETIKWSRNLKRRLRLKKRETFSEKRIIETAYRPFVTAWLYQSPLFVDEMSLTQEIFPVGRTNSAICFTDPHGQKPWMVCAVSRPADLHYVGSGAGTICVCRYRYIDGKRVENVTDWALKQFVAHYKKIANPKRPIDKGAVFYYVYSVLHDPIYREKYALNLKREFPSIPFYANFWSWVEWGEKLMELHIAYETVEPWPLDRIDAPDERARKAGLAPKALLKANKDSGNLQLDSETQLTGVPPAAWSYKLGNRSALEWILDQHKEKTPKDVTIREKFNRYRFADQKEKVVDLLKRVTRVSVKTMEILDAMVSAPR